jgi:hypothetical protein
MRPKEPGSTSVIRLWAHRAIETDPAVRDWQVEHGEALAALSPTGCAPETVEELGATIAAEFHAEGAVEAITEISAAIEAAYRELADALPDQQLGRELPNGMQIDCRVSDLSVLPAAVTLTYPSTDGTACLRVLRDGRLGQLTTVADALAERYLIPASEIVWCILTGQPPRISPIRLGVRFRRFNVDGVPVTANSRLVLDVDPQLEPAELARIFVQWQRAAGVKPSKASPKLVPLAAELIGRLSLLPADRNAQAKSHPSELIGIGNRSWWLVPTVPWARLAREIKFDGTLIRGRAAAVIHLLVPLDAPGVPRWLPEFPIGGSRSGSRTPIDVL